jgi:hypothetical protein
LEDVNYESTKITMKDATHKTFARRRCRSLDLLAKAFAAPSTPPFAAAWRLSFL